MRYYNDDVEGLFTGKKNNGDVAGAFTGRRKRDRDEDVAGAFTGRRKRNREDVAGVVDENFRVPVKGFVNSEDLCRAVRQCLINDLVAAAEADEEDHDRKRHSRKRR